jgi:methionine biosynthesis protein MetW
MTVKHKRRQVDYQIIARWVNEGDRVLDLGCGRGMLLEYLKRKKSIYGVGVDINFERILSCVKRGVSAYHGDVRALLATFDDNAFDRVIFSRSVELLDDPDAILSEGLRVGKHVTVGFVNHGFWLNRVNFLFKGQHTVNEVYPDQWYQSLRSNPFSVNEFDAFCQVREIKIENRAYLAGDWSSDCKWMPNLLAGYALYDLSSQS